MGEIEGERKKLTLNKDSNWNVVRQKGLGQFAAMHALLGKGMVRPKLSKAHAFSFYENPKKRALCPDSTMTGECENIRDSCAYISQS